MLDKAYGHNKKWNWFKDHMDYCTVLADQHKNELLKNPVVLLRRLYKSTRNLLCDNSFYNGQSQEILSGR